MFYSALLFLHDEEVLQPMVLICWLIFCRLKMNICMIKLKLVVEREGKKGEEEEEIRERIGRVETQRSLPSR